MNAKYDYVKYLLWVSKKIKDANQSIWLSCYFLSSFYDVSIILLLAKIYILICSCFVSRFGPVHRGNKLGKQYHSWCGTFSSDSCFSPTSCPVCLIWTETPASQLVVHQEGQDVLVLV